MEVKDAGDNNASSHVSNEEYEELDAECNAEESEICNELNSNNRSLQNYSREPTLLTTCTKNTGFKDTHNKNMRTETYTRCTDADAQGAFDYQGTPGLIKQTNLMIPKLLIEAAIQDKQKEEMRALCNQLVVTSKQHKEQDFMWTERVITKVCNYS